MGIWGAASGGLSELQSNAGGYRLDQALFSRELQANKQARQSLMGDDSDKN